MRRQASCKVTCVLGMTSEGPCLLPSLCCRNSAGHLATRPAVRSPARQPVLGVCLCLGPRPSKVFLVERGPDIRCGCRQCAIWGRPARAGRFAARRLRSTERRMPRTRWPRRSRLQTRRAPSSTRRWQAVQGPQPRAAKQVSMSQVSCLVAVAGCPGPCALPASHGACLMQPKLGGCAACAVRIAPFTLRL